MKKSKMAKVDLHIHSKFSNHPTELKKIYHCEPDLVYVSTPSPIGFLGLIVSKIFNDERSR
jgi:hypothetical protein